MFDFVPRNLVGTVDVLKRIRNAKYKHAIEGVTFLGGEPMLQARGLSEVACGCKENKLSVMVFTGYSFDYLNKNPMPGVSDLLKYTDLLVDGPFIAKRPERTRNWVGSTNQHFHFLTQRYKTGIELDPFYSHGLELRIFNDGTIQTNGWPSGIKMNDAMEQRNRVRTKPSSSTPLSKTRSKE